jgi:hypothetical protein
MEDLFLAYKKERRLYLQISFVLKWMGNLSLLAFISILVFMKDIPIQYSILTYYSILCRVGGMVCLKYFEIPNLVSEFASGKVAAYSVIHTHRHIVLKELFKSLYGLGFDRTLLDIHQPDLLNLLQGLERRNWKKFGILFAVFFGIMNLVTLWVLFF